MYDVQMFTVKMSTMKIITMKMCISPRFFEEPFAQTLSGMTRKCLHASRDMRSQSHAYFGCMFKDNNDKHDNGPVSLVNSRTNST